MPEIGLTLDDDYENCPVFPFILVFLLMLASLLCGTLYWQAKQQIPLEQQQNDYQHIQDQISITTQRLVAEYLRSGIALI